MGNKNKETIKDKLDKMYMSEVRRLAKEEIKEYRRRHRGEKPDDKTRSKIMDKADKKVRFRLKFAAIALACGISAFGGYKTHQMLNSGNPAVRESAETMEIDADKTEQDITIKSNDLNNREVFINNYKVTENTIKYNEEYVKNEVSKEINNLNTKEDVLDYVKDMYADVYNQEYDEKINKEDVTFSRDRNYLGTKLERDKAKNGDDICRLDTDIQNGAYFESGLITVTVRKDDKVSSKSVAGSAGNYIGVYNKDEEVLEDKDSLLIDKMGGVIDTGIEWATQLDRINLEGEVYTNNNWDLISVYKENFIDYVTECKMENISEYIKADETINNEKSDSER